MHTGYQTYDEHDERERERAASVADAIESLKRSTPFLAGWLAGLEEARSLSHDCGHDIADLWDMIDAEAKVLLEVEAIPVCQPLVGDSTVRFVFGRAQPSARAIMKVLSSNAEKYGYNADTAYDLVDIALNSSELPMTVAKRGYAVTVNQREDGDHEVFIARCAVRVPGEGR